MQKKVFEFLQAVRMESVEARYYCSTLLQGLFSQQLLSMHPQVA